MQKDPFRGRLLVACRNKTKNLIRNAKRTYFADSVESSKNTSSIWKHLSAVNNGSTSKANSMPDELIINNKHILDSNTIASKLNEYFSSIVQILNRNNTGTNQLDLTKLIEYLNNKVLYNTYFNIPSITTEQLFSVINSLDIVRPVKRDWAVLSKDTPLDISI